MFNPPHCGLFFTSDHIDYARSHADDEPFASALALLHQHSPNDPNTIAQWHSFQYKYGDDDAGEQTLEYLQQHDFVLAHDVVEAAQVLIVLAQSFEMIRDHKAVTHTFTTHWWQAFSGAVETLNTTTDLALHEQLWIALLHVAAGIVVEDETRFDTGVSVARHFIEHEIRPQGHIPALVEIGDGSGLYRQLLATQALVLIAEAATHAGVDLWAYHHRGVSVMTPVVYLLYYYFDADQWPWDPSPEAPDESSENVDEPRVHPLFDDIKGFWEIAHHYGRPRDFKPLLEKTRPIYDPYGGGLTTLTHGLLLKQRRGLFG